MVPFVKKFTHIPILILELKGGNYPFSSQKIIKPQ